MLVQGNNISISGVSPALNYGQQCYEGMKAFRQAPSSSSSSEKIVVFRPQFHAVRLARSAASVCLAAPSEELFLSCLRLVVAANATYVPPVGTPGFLYIRPVLFGASTQLGLAPADETVFAIYVLPITPYHGNAALDALVLEDFDRAAPRGMGGYKVGGNYAPVWRHANKAKEMGYGITLHLDSATRTMVEEFSTSGFLGARADEDGNITLLVPKTDSAIQSATSECLVRLAELEGWKIEHREVEFSSLPSLSEVVAVGTAAAAVPIRSITRLSTSDKFTFLGTSGGEGSESKMLGLAKIMSQIQRGQVKDTEGWCWEVTVLDDDKVL
jgi:branched-chain amino acid aminotransferase